MRKTLLTMCLAPTLAFAQVPQGQNNVAVPVKHSPNVDRVSPVRVNTGIKTPTGGSAGTDREWLFTETKIGETNYDLQVNTALARRVTLASDGTVSATWTYASDNTPYITRGTAYNSFNGSEWGPEPLTRLEDGRAGWSNLGIWNDGGTEREVVISHYAAYAAGDPSGGIYVMVNDKVGSSDFKIVNKLDNANNKGPFWPRMAITNNYLHMYAAWNRDRADSMMEGINRPNTYWRYDLSKDEWIDKEVLLPGYDSSRVSFGMSDAYFMDAHDDAVAIVAGSALQDFYLWKSLDNGDTWEVTFIDSFPIPKFDGLQLLDTTEVTTGSVSVILDDNNIAHVFSDYLRVIDQDIDNPTFSLFPGSNGIRYWNEITKEHVIIAGAPDIDGDGSISIPPSQADAASNNGFRYGNTGLAAFPSAAIDGDGTLYCVYSAVNESAPSPDGPVYRDVYVVYKTKDGEWSDIQPLIESKETEDMFASVARDVNDKLHVVWQRDDYVATNLQHNHVQTINEIMYAGVPTSLIKENKLKIGRSSINESNIAKNEVYPNPANESVNFAFELLSNSNVTITITNVLGQVVLNKNLGTLNSGSNKVVLNTADLGTGVYIYNINSGNSTTSGRLSIN